MALKHAKVVRVLEDFRVRHIPVAHGARVSAPARRYFTTSVVPATPVVAEALGDERYMGRFAAASTGAEDSKRSARSWVPPRMEESIRTRSVTGIVSKKATL